MIVVILEIWDFIGVSALLCSVLFWVDMLGHGHTVIHIGGLGQ